jgi:hypothetical protein
MSDETEDNKEHVGEGILKWMRELNISITRQNFIDANWGDDPPDPWTVEAEAEIPPELQDWTWLEDKYK